MYVSQAIPQVIKNISLIATIIQTIFKNISNNKLNDIIFYSDYRVWKMPHSLQQLLDFFYDFLKKLRKHERTKTRGSVQISAFSFIFCVNESPESMKEYRSPIGHTLSCAIARINVKLKL